MQNLPVLSGAAARNNKMIQDFISSSHDKKKPWEELLLAIELKRKGMNEWMNLFQHIYVKFHTCQDYYMYYKLMITMGHYYDTGIQLNIVDLKVQFCIHMLGASQYHKWCW